MSIKSVFKELSEHEEQCLFVNWFEIQFPKVRIFAIPNGTWSRNIQTAIKAKREGVRKGVPDLYIPEWKLWIEMKRSKGGTISKEQKEWHRYLEEACGDIVIITKGFNEAREMVLRIKGLKSPIP